MMIIADIVGMALVILVVYIVFRLCRKKKGSLGVSIINCFVDHNTRI